MWRLHVHIFLTVLVLVSVTEAQCPSLDGYDGDLIQARNTCFAVSNRFQPSLKGSRDAVTGECASKGGNLARMDDRDSVNILVLALRRKPPEGEAAPCFWIQGRLNETNGIWTDDTGTPLKYLGILAILIAEISTDDMKGLDISLYYRGAKCFAYHHLNFTVFQQRCEKICFFICQYATLPTTTFTVDTTERPDMETTWKQSLETTGKPSLEAMGQANPEMKKQLEGNTIARTRRVKPKPARVERTKVFKSVSWLKDHLLLSRTLQTWTTYSVTSCARMTASIGAALLNYNAKTNQCIAFDLAAMNKSKQRADAWTVWVS